MENWQEREELLIGKDNIEKLKNATVAVFGCGGVGSYAVEALARAGIGNFVLVDKDVVDVTNINRQLVADFSTIGRDKVEVEKERILRVNPDAKVEIYKEFYCEENKDKLIREDYTYIVDAIDSVSSKLSLIITAHEKNVKIISAMGMGNKLDPTQIEVSDISKTSVCPLAKTIRKQLRANGINHLKVVYSRELPNRFDKSEEYRRTTASISFVPSVGGLIIASQIVRDLIDEAKKQKNLELVDKLIEIKLSLSEIEDENRDLKKKIEELEQSNIIEEDLELLPKGYYIRKSEKAEGKDIKYCVACWQNIKKLMPYVNSVGSSKICCNCHNIIH